jgi:hypothetical protein
MMVRSKKTKIVREYKNRQGITFRIGDTVSLTRKAFQVHDPTPPTKLLTGKRIVQGKIVSLFPDVEGLALVEPKLGGFHTWDVNDLRKI